MKRIAVFLILCLISQSAAAAPIDYSKFDFNPSFAGAGGLDASALIDPVSMNGFISDIGATSIIATIAAVGFMFALPIMIMVPFGYFGMCAFNLEKFGSFQFASPGTRAKNSITPIGKARKVSIRLRASSTSQIGGFKFGGARGLARGFSGIKIGW